MRLLLINQYAGSPGLGMEYRPHWMATEWIKSGHQVLVVAGDYSHLRREQPPVGISTVEGVDYATLRTPRYEGNGARRLANIAAFRAQLALNRGHLQRWRPDVVIASSTHPMDVRPALSIARASGALMVHEVHDLWPLTPRLLGSLSPRHPMIMWMQREEDLACRRADLVVSMLPATLPYLQTRGLDEQRWTYVSNGVPDDFVATPPARPLPADGVFRVGYFGGHQVSNGLSTAVEAARLLAAEPVELHLTGSGTEKESLQEMAAGMTNVKFHPEVPPPVARQQMREMDALLLTAAPTPLYEHGIGQNKLFEYMATGLPVIQAIHAAGSPVDLAGCGYTCAAGDPEAMAELIRRMRGLDPSERQRLGHSGYDYVRREATYSALADKFIGAVESVSSRHS